MMITVHLSDGRKITKDPTKLRFITDPEGWWDKEDMQYRIVEDGCITINWAHVVDMRPAEEDEIQHAQIHGW